MLLQILNYNNYYNRIVKYLDTYEEYAPYVVYNLNGANFNPNDNVNTTHVFGDSLNSYNGMGDYLIVVGVNNNIESRWFIIESKRNRGGQWTLELRRDLLADYKYRYEQMPAFIEKAYVDNPYDPAIFNKENMSFNQIKTEETLLKDPTGVKWVVGYCAKDFNVESLSIQNPELSESIITGIDIEEFRQYAIGGNKFLYTNPSNKRVRYVVNFPYAERHRSFYINTESNAIIEDDIYNGIDTAGWSSFSYNGILDEQQVPLKAYLTEYFSLYKGEFNNLFLTTYYPDINYIDNKNFIQNYNDKYIEKDGRYYRIKVINTGLKIIEKDEALRDYINGWDEYRKPIIELVKNLKESYLNENQTGTIVRADFDSYQIQLIDETYLFEQGSLKISIPAGRHKTIDAIYDIFAIPVTDDALAIVGNDVNILAPATSINIAQQLVYRYGIGASSKIYDLQLLPYCPLQNVLNLNVDTEDGIIDINGLVQGVDYVLVSTEDETPIVKNIIFFASQTKTNFRINKSITITDVKESNECDVYRLTSGDYSSCFEFSPAKNGGVNYFECDCTFKPYSPYIHIAPNFKGLYGQDFNDPRGLICGGDFSLSTITDPFNTYKLQNKNFQLAFDRQIENMEVQHDVQRVQDIIGGIMGGVQTAGIGAGLGAVIGGATASVPGAIAGGIAGAGLGGAAGGTDYFLNERLRNEAIDFSKDMFGYQLGNIKALPNTLNKVDSFTNNNKVFPVLEYFTCTAQERQAFRDKIRFNGMSIGRIGTIAEWVKYFETYIKARLIRITDLNEDLHVANELANEINKGFFIGGSNG